MGPACVMLGLAWGMKTWKETEHERQFWEGCAMLRQYANEPALQCIYTPPEVAEAEPLRAAVAAQELVAP